MKRSKSILLTATIAFGLSAMASWSASATTLFSDNFVTDTSLGSEYGNINNTTAATVTEVNGTGLEMNVSAGTGKTSEEFAQFGSAVTLTEGESLILTVAFSGVNVSLDTGYIMAGLYNTQGTVNTTTETSTATGGATANDTGYFGNVGYGSYANGGNKFYARTPGGSMYDELTYYSHETGSYTQVGTTLAQAGNGDMADYTPYILTFTISDLGAGGNDITEEITDASDNVLGGDMWTVNDPSSTFTSFDELAFGFYGKSQMVDGTVTSVSVALVPEPSIFAFAGLGLAGLVLRFRRR